MALGRLACMIVGEARTDDTFMTTPRQNEVERLYQAALAAPVGARAALLAQASDAEVQREVEARLDQTASMAAPLVPGRSLGRYRILVRAGAGGMGEVYRARDTRLNRDVALKVLPPHLAAQPGFLARFEQEARAASALNHPHVVSTYDVGTEDGVAYIVSEFVDGQSLRQALHQKPMPLRTVLKVATELADGLAAAHRAGIVHRDLKPENVMLTGEGTAKIVDFGLALVLGAAGPHTLTGIVLGTPAYMSPEQATSQPTDHRADQFALGAMHTPVFSRDGSKIAVLCSALAGAAWPDLWILPFPSGTPRLARSRLPYSLALGGRLSWMPDNRHLVMSGSIEDGSSHL